MVTDTFFDNIIHMVEACLAENPCAVEVRYNEPMAAHSTFRAGGPADCWLKPSGENFPAFAAALLAAARAGHIPVFVLGGGANILAADAGIRGIVLDTGGWAGETGRRQEGILEFRAGTNIDAAAEIAADAGLSGLEFLAGMPGSIGGAVWMNARCYGQEIADVITETEVIDFSGSKPERLRLPANKSEFSYKHSPFQGRDVLILSASFHLTPGKEQQIRALMDSHRKDREAKGHYRYPSAGSVFKNNPAFGKPTGQIIDELGLCGLRTGGAQVAPWHGNIIVNTGGASASDIRTLIDEVTARVKTAAGFDLEPEILFIGN
ncbi:MAG: UDP-N-acetylmuramate dehydrogenase [Treponema sp.]|jgi:UDP-N-acetylmuramate dehydrogenase|nr:UDP-N-acetylmuramate dehydrogenase [Treponema sp.]